MRHPAFAQNLVVSRWFALFQLVSAFLAGLIWYTIPEVGGWPLLIAFIPWALRLAAGRPIFRRTLFDPAVWVFLLTAGVSLWAAYNRQAAQDKFWLIVASIFIYYALASLSADTFWFAAAVLSAVGFLMAASFLLSYDWSLHSIDLAILKQVGLWWMGIRPEVPALGMQANIAGGLLAVLLPFPLALGWWLAHHPQTLKSTAIQTGMVVSAWVTAGLMAATLLLTSSRGAWIALLVGLAVWVAWRISLWVARQRNVSSTLVLALIVLASGIFFAGLLYFSPGGPLGFIDRLPGLPSGLSRWELVQNSIHLVADYPITGGGLQAFPGLYSQYIQVIPFFYFSYSHNLYLDVMVEQGWLALLAFSIVIAGTLWLTVRETRQVESDLGVFKSAVLVALAVVLVHGLVDDALYGIRGTPLLFFLPGMALARGASLEINGRRAAWTRLQFAGLAALAAAGLLTFFAFDRPLASTWFSNLGAVQMAKVELSDYPSGEWKSGQNLNDLQPAEISLIRALRINPDNRTAQHRMGLIALLHQDFPAAVGHLERAYELDPGHRGIRKALGYSYAWDGKLDQSVSMLADIPEAESEMKVYIHWWQQQNREDLALKAQQVYTRLQRTS
ncbi:MAG: O-antigen ligase family protein [Anaerolineales bacterium]